MFATHDASANFYLEGVSDIYGRINIGNYVFIGMGTIIYSKCNDSGSLYYSSRICNYEKFL